MTTTLCTQLPLMFDIATQAEVDLARERFSNDAGSIQIDDDAAVTRGDGGTWVQAWVWLSEPSTSTSTA
mgnify:CR=1 FL=1